VTGRSALFSIFKSSLILAAGALLGGIGVYQISGESRAAPGVAPSSTSSRLNSLGTVHALGSIQPKDGIVEVALPAGFLPTRFGEGVVQDGPVKKGQVIAYLEGYEARLREIEVIDAEIASAESALKVEDENEKLTLAEIDRECLDARELGKMEQVSLALRIAALKDKYSLSQKQFRDIDGLQVNNTIPRQQYDQYAAQEKISLEELKYAEAEASRVDRSLKLKTDPSSIEQQKERARVLAKRARSQIAIDTLIRKKALAVAMLQRNVVLSPIDGVVLDICTKAGESGTGKPLVKLGDISTMYVLAEIYEDERRLVDHGQKVKVTGRGLPNLGGEPIGGTVERINSIIGAHKQSPLDPTSRDNGRVFPAWIALDLDEKSPGGKARLEKLRRLVLMPVEVWILVDDEKPPGGG
jgi:ABC exporter DevB family membrane fusion protein